MQKTQNKIALKSQEMLIEALIQLLKLKEYKEISISEITSTAGLDRKTFYRNFDAKEDLLKQYCHSLALEMVEGIKRKGNLSRRNDITVSFFEMWSSHLELLRILKKNKLHYLLLEEFYEMLSIVRKELRPELDSSMITEEIQYALDFNIGGYWNLLFRWLEEDFKMSPKEMADIIDRLFNDNEE